MRAKKVLEFLEVKEDWYEEEGKCPKCQLDLNYGSGELQDDQFVYDVDCPNCGWSGTEWYKMEFVGHEK
jgi:ssDNA-binding Zn-finger/Zn-ribbon topoisomerase 1